MKKIIFLLMILCFASVSFAKDVYIKGYYKKNGTYVKPHTRSAPNQYKWDNYGRDSGNKSYSTPYSSPYNRDYDKDGIYNQNDTDDDNDGVSDDDEKD